MRTLTLMRHAKSSWDDAALDDHDRPLNRRGEKAAKTMACRLEASGFVPDLVIASSALRTQETARALQKCYKGRLEIQTEPLLYEASVEGVLDVIRGVGGGVKNLLLVGHNPTTELLAEQLSGRYYKLPTAAYIRFKVPSSWHDFALRTYAVEDYDFPKSDG